MSEAVQHIVHPLPPVWDMHSRVLILGTMPSPKSREIGFYYAHPQNRFWPTLAQVFGEETPRTTEARRAFALRRHIALWDVLHSCEITGASDSSIRNPVVNNLTELLQNAPIQAICTTGATAARMYRKYLLPQTGREAIELPSTSPANCRWYTQQRLMEIYGLLRAYCI